MIRSMTGYGRGEAKNNDLSVTVELKSVNHRFFECTVKSPRQFSFLDDKVKSYIQSRVSRGKIDVFISCDSGGKSADKIEINYEYADAYVAALKALGSRYHLKKDISVMSVAANNDVFCIKSGKLDEEAAAKLITEASDKAVDAFILARESEGKRLEDDVKQKANAILGMVEVVEKRSPETVEEYRVRLENKVKELLYSSEIDEQRIITETAIFADRIAVNEETVRLRSHIAHLNEMFQVGGVIGKKLDFIVQEMNREANTIGSKCQDLDISRVVVNIKSEIEKIREQIQNIE